MSILSTAVCCLCAVLIGDRIHLLCTVIMLFHRSTTETAVAFWKNHIDNRTARAAWLKAGLHAAECKFAIQMVNTPTVHILYIYEPKPF